MRIGKLRHRVRIERPDLTQDPATGEMVAGWALVRSAWASVEPLSAREFIAAGANQSQLSARITMRHKGDITPDMRIIHRGHEYNIEGVLPDPKSGLHYVTIPVSEGVTDGG